MASKAQAERPVQPRCVNPVRGKPCNHPRSFHGTDSGKCRALGCTCRRLRLAKVA